jgi:hypothetical protein
MAFLLYQTTPLADGSRRYRYVQNVVLAGNGLIYLACQKYLGTQDVGWTITSADMLVAGGHNPSEHELVIDIAPSRPTVSLYEIKAISGYSYDAWTPLMLSFESLFGDAEAPSGKDAMKREFTDVTCERLLVREFLYPTGGYAERSWNWGGNSRTTAALLFQDAWDYFERNMKPA